MSGGWWIAVIGGALLLFPLVLDFRFGTEARLARWWVPWARHKGSPALWSFLLSLGALAAYSGCALAGAALGSAAGDPHWALVPALPAMVAYAPFVCATMPVQYGGYRAWRQELAQAGAEPALQRRIAWPAGIPSFLGMMAVIVTLFPIFLP